jgi:hypothetical protein
VQKAHCPQGNFEIKIIQLVLPKTISLVIRFMSERKKVNIKIDTKHPNANIHGVVGLNNEFVCLTQKGKMCTGCCALKVTPVGSEYPVLNEDGHYCSHAVEGVGCKDLLEGGDPRNRISGRCKLYRCSNDRSTINNPNQPIEVRNAAHQRLSVANAQALKNGEISKAEYRENTTFRIGEPLIKVDLSDSDDWYDPKSATDEDDLINHLIEIDKKKLQKH